MKESPPALPGHYELTRGQYLFSCASIATAFVLLAALALRILAHGDLRHWWVPASLSAGILAADFGSGLVHWGADTWGHDDCPWIGPRLLVPFRVHHINPNDFLRRRFVDTNGEVAAIAVPVLIALLLAPLDSLWGGPLAVFGLAFCGVGSMTNQIHQWAHMPTPPAPVRFMQSRGLLLSRIEHAAHHERPYDRRYCITTGWCNAPLDAIDFFRCAEMLVTRITGVQPRDDDRVYEAKYGAPSRSTGAS